MYTGYRNSVLVISSKGIIAAALVLLALGLVFCRKPSNEDSRIAKVEDELVKSNQLVVDLTHKIELTSLKVIQMKSQLDNMSEDNKANKNRILLLGTLFNENMAAIYKRCYNDIMFIGRHWQVNRMPKYLDMTEEDIEWFKQFVNSKLGAAPSIIK